MKIKQFANEIVLFIQYPLILYIGFYWSYLEQPVLGPLEIMHLAPVISCVLSRAMITTRKKVFGETGLLVYLFFFVFLISFAIIRPPWGTAIDLGEPPAAFPNVPPYIMILILGGISLVLQLRRIRAYSQPNDGNAG